MAQLPRWSVKLFNLILQRKLLLSGFMMATMPFLGLRGAQIDSKGKISFLPVAGHVHHGQQAVWLGLLPLRTVVITGPPITRSNAGVILTLPHSIHGVHHVRTYTLSGQLHYARAVFGIGQTHIDLHSILGPNPASGVYSLVVSSQTGIVLQSIISVAPR